MSSLEIGTLKNLQKKVLLILEDGKKIETTAEEALKASEESGYDLMKVSEQQDFSVCRLMDVKKEEYRKNQLQKEAKKQLIKMKEFKFGFNIALRDIEVKVKHIEEILEKGNKAKIVVVGRKRQNISSVLISKMESILSMIGHPYSKDSNIKMMGENNCVCNISPSSKLKA